MLRVMFFAIVAVTSANVIHEGSCPESIQPIKAFNATAYQGVWYEISKFPTEAEKNGKCGSAEYTLDGDVVKVKNTHVVDGVQTFIEGTARFSDDAKDSAKLIVTFKFGDLVRQSPLSIVATDYTNYAVANTCKYDDKKKSHEDNFWILSRSKKLEGDAKAAVDAYLKEHSKEIDTSNFVHTDFSEEACKFTGTSLITEAPNKR
ncbi:hypothetical protein K1T71_010657 [Dendrolimus kikuchii]|uniref:Uncharacterized protein n=1 Tax=Dendrolimus kikuchii TaxID=765133 RepID=A0ACC1CPI0_9NEOP|nr:hypothetical protein K1T71_010657 [Dendrolimus kikuchii]